MIAVASSFLFFLSFLFFYPNTENMQPTSTSSSSLFGKRSTSMARASVFVDPQPATPQSDDHRVYAPPHSSIFTTSRQPNLVGESTSSKSSSAATLAPIGVRRAFGELTNHHRDTPRFQSSMVHKKLPLSSINLMALNQQQQHPSPAKPLHQQHEEDPSSRFLAHSFDPFGTTTEMDPFGLNQLGLAANTTTPFGQRM